MPIRGYSDICRLPRAGKIKLGEKQEKKREDGTTVNYPVALPYFVVPPEVAEIYGDKPTMIDVIFPANDREIIFPQYMKKYGTTGLYCKGDGYTGTMLVNGQLTERECNPDDEWCRDCQPKGTLNVWLPKVKTGGVYQVVTGSWNSIVNINSMLDTIEVLAGRIAGIPLILKVVPHEATIANGDKQFRRTVYVITLDFTETPEEFLRKYGPTPRHLLTAGEQELLARQEEFRTKWAMATQPGTGSPSNSPETVTVEEDEEELSPADSPPPPPAQAEQSTLTPQNGETKANGVFCTERQQKMIHAIASEKKISREQLFSLIREQLGVKVDTTKRLTRKQASRFIDYLQKYNAAAGA